MSNTRRPTHKNTGSFFVRRKAEKIEAKLTQEYGRQKNNVARAAQNIADEMAGKWTATSFEDASGWHGIWYQLDASHMKQNLKICMHNHEMERTAAACARKNARVLGEQQLEPAEVVRRARAVLAEIARNAPKG